VQFALLKTGSSNVNAKEQFAGCRWLA